MEYQLTGTEDDGDTDDMGKVRKISDHKYDGEHSIEFDVNDNGQLVMSSKFKSKNCMYDQD